MNLNFEWSKPLKLSEAEGAIYRIELSRVPTGPGIYVFGRKYDGKYEALYVGKATEIRPRVKTQLNNLKLMRHVEDAKSGDRVLLTALFRPRPGHPTEKSLLLMERALIRLFLAEGHDLVNRQGTSLRQHEITSSKRPAWLVPKKIFLEK